MSQFDDLVILSLKLIIEILKLSEISNITKEIQFLVKKLKILIKKNRSISQ